MFCRNCGDQLTGIGRFCGRCGSPVSSDDTNRPGFLAQGSTNAYQKGDTLVIPIPGNITLPPRCVKCADPASEPRLHKTFYWHHPAVYLLLISPIIYAVVALIVRKTAIVFVPLCEAHKSERKSRLWLAAALLIGSIPLPVALGMYIQNDTGIVIAVCLGIVMLIVGLIFINLASPIRPTYIGPQTAEFKGACQAFLSCLTPGFDEKARAQTVH